MWIDGSNRVWLGGDKGRLFLLDQSSGRYHSIKIDCLRSPNDQLQVITGNEHFIYLGFQYSGIIRYDLSKKAFLIFLLGLMNEKSYLYMISLLMKIFFGLQRKKVCIAMMRQQNVLLV